MARLVYACRFDVSGHDGISSVLSAYRDWIVLHYRDRRKLAAFDFEPEIEGASDDLPEGHALSSSVYQDDEHRVALIRWSFPDENDGGLRWANEVRVGQFGERCGVEHLISIESIEYNISPARLLFGSPRAVRDICTKTPAYVGEMQVGADPYVLVQDQLNDLMPLLTSDLRRLPVILLSPYARGEPNQIDPAKLARNLAGVAVVVHIEDPELTWDFADEVGRQLSCFHGAARIYWPKFSKASDPRSHRLFLGEWIDKAGPDVAGRTIERAIFAVAAFRYVPDGRISDLIRRVEYVKRQQLFDENKAAGDDFWADYERDLSLLDEAKKRLEELETENATLKANQQVLFAAGHGSPDELDRVGEAEDLSFSSVSEAVQTAADRCENLELLDTAT